MDSPGNNKCITSSDMRPINEIPYPYQEVFSSYPCFNSVQSKVLEDVLYSDESIVISAPTGSGKTVIFELALIRALVTFGADMLSTMFKAVYICPMKALCEERLIDWHKKFSKYGLNCVSVTGDSDHSDFQSLLNHNVVITTPEKWDSLTRKWKDYKEYVELFKLVMIDEIHLLNEEGRGSTLETIVCRMKIIGNLSYYGDGGKFGNTKIRFVAVSATIPNIEDIADWIGSPKQAINYKFSEDLRPVKLNRLVFGYPFDSNTKSYFKFDLTLNYKLKNHLLQYSDGKPTLIFCNTRKSTEMTSKFIVQNLSINLNPEQKLKLVQAAKSISDKKVSDILIYGVSYHHAGLLPQTRNVVESLFKNNDLPILVTTSTLAMGVNLPAHLVIIKSTKYYNKGLYQDYTESAILQMIGRAGRPQYDTSATALILTTTFDKEKFENMVGGNQSIESNLHKHLTEHLNSEVVLRTITGLDVAMDWLSSTFLYIRARRNPKHYGLSPALSVKQIDRKLLEMCQIEINKLVTSKMLILNQDIVITPTVLGTIMAKYCIAFETMKMFTQIKGTETLQEILNIISKCHEFSEMYLRTDDKKCLNLLNHCSNRQTIRFPLNGKIKTINMKINCIIQAIFGCLEIFNHSIITEGLKIIKNGERVAKCLTEYLETQDKSYFALLNSIIVAKCFHVQLWENSPYVSKQLQGVGKILSQQLVSAKKTTFQSILNSGPREIEVIIKRKPPMGNDIIDQVKYLPQYELLFEEVSEKNTKKELKLRIFLKNAVDLETKCTANVNSFMCLLVGDAQNQILLYEKYTHSYMIENPEVVKYITIDFPVPDYVEANFISLNWVGIDCTSKHHFAKSTPEPVAQVKNKKQTTTKNTSVDSPQVNRKKNNPLGLIPELQKRVDSYFTKKKKKLQNFKEARLEINSDKETKTKINNKKQNKSAETTPNLKNLWNGMVATKTAEKCQDLFHSKKVAEDETDKANSESTNIAELISTNVQNSTNLIDDLNTKIVTEKPTSFSEESEKNIDKIDLECDEKVSPTTNQNDQLFDEEKNINCSSNNIDCNEREDGDIDCNETPENKKSKLNFTDHDTSVQTEKESNMKTADLNNTNLNEIAKPDFSKEFNIFLQSLNDIDFKVSQNSPLQQELNDVASNNNNKNNQNTDERIVILENIVLNSTKCNKNNTPLFQTNTKSCFDSEFKENCDLITDIETNKPVGDECYKSNAVKCKNEISSVFKKTFLNKRKNFGLNPLKNRFNKDVPAEKFEQSLYSPPKKRKFNLEQFEKTRSSKMFQHERCQYNNTNTANYSRTVAEALQPRKKPKYDETLEKEADYIINASQNYSPLQQREGMSKTITWRSPLVYSPPKKFSPKKTTFNDNIFFRNDSFSDPANTTFETCSSSKNIQAQGSQQFKMPLHAKINYSQLTQLNNARQSKCFPLGDNNYIESSSSNSSQEDSNRSLKSKDKDNSLSSLCSPQFLESFGIKDSSSKLDLLNKKQSNEISSTCDYYSKLLYEQNHNEETESKEIKTAGADNSKVTVDKENVVERNDNFVLNNSDETQAYDLVGTTQNNVQSSHSNQINDLYKSSFLEQTANNHSQFNKTHDFYPDYFQNKQINVLSPFNRNPQCFPLQNQQPLFENDGIPLCYRKPHITHSQGENALNQTMYSQMYNDSNNAPKLFDEGHNFFQNIYDNENNSYIRQPYNQNISHCCSRSQPNYSHTFNNNRNVYSHDSFMQPYPNDSGFDSMSYYRNNINIPAQTNLNQTQFIDYYDANINYLPNHVVHPNRRPMSTCVQNFPIPVRNRSSQSYCPSLIADDKSAIFRRHPSEISENKLFATQQPYFENPRMNASQNLFEHSFNDALHPAMLQDNPVFPRMSQGYNRNDFLCNTEGKHYVMNRFLHSVKNERINRDPNENI